MIIMYLYSMWRVKQLYSKRKVDQIRYLCSIGVWLWITSALLALRLYTFGTQRVARQQKIVKSKVPLVVPISKLIWSVSLVMKKVFSILGVKMVPSISGKETV
jgi:hypothetical protein